MMENVQEDAGLLSDRHHHQEGLRAVRRYGLDWRRRAVGEASSSTWIYPLRGAIIVATLVSSACLLIAGTVGGRPHASKALRSASISAVELVMQKPKGDPRSYQHTALPNGVEVLNIYDATAMTSAYAVAVLAGSFDDPIEFPGLAHFCEHMVFLGSKSYPVPDGYDRFLAQHGGSSNAYTDDEVTVYFSELSHSAFTEGLARFSEFFSSPLFDEQYVEKEVQAIDSEHGKNVQDPTWRVQDLMQSLASSESPASRFHTGDKQTLYKEPKQKGLDPVDALRKWYKEHYCPSKMRLVTFGPDSLEDQFDIASRFFANISNGSAACQAPRKSWATPAAWPERRLGKWINVLGTQPQTDLVVFFPLPDLSEEFLSQPGRYLQYVLTYGGQQAFKTVLRDDLGVASSFHVSFQDSSIGTSLFIKCRLARNGREHPELVLDMLFQYITRLRADGVDSQLYGSLANVSQLSWDWRELQHSVGAASSIVERMTRLPPEKLLSGDFLIEEPKPELVASLLERLTPQNMNVALVDPDAESTLFKGREVQKLPHYGIAYTVEELATRLPSAVDRWSTWTSSSDSAKAFEELQAELQGAGLAAAPEPRPPKAIEGVPSELPLEHMKAKRAEEGEEPGAEPNSTRDVTQVLYGSPPELLMSSDGTQDLDKVWYREGWMTTSPKALIEMKFQILRDEGDLEFSALDSLRLGFYTSLLAEELVPKLVDLTAAGASIDISLSSKGASLSVGGFPPLIPRLMDQFLEEFTKGVNLTDLSRYHRLYREYNQSLREHSGMPVDYAIHDRGILLTPRVHSDEESLEALNNTQPENVGNAAKDLVFSNPLRLTALAMGNMGPKDAEEVIHTAVDKLVPQRSSDKASVPGLTPIVKPAQPIELRKLNPRAGDGNDAVVVTLIAGVSTVESRVVLGLLGQLIQPLAYSELRTQQQLGYIVNAGLGTMSNVQHISTIVQGDKLRSDELEAAAEQVYLDLMPQRLQNLSDSEFQGFKDSFRQSLLEPPVGLSNEFDHFWPWIVHDATAECFGLQGEMLRFLDALRSKAPLIEAWDALIAPGNGTRRKVVVKYFAGEEVPDRPSKEAAEGLWEAKGVPSDKMDLLRQEYDNTLVLSKADSSIRARLAKEGGYFPRDLHCKVASGAEEEKEPVADAAPKGGPLVA